ncbi:MAG: DEAD/DEAH box helicase [Chitinophagaceae bacterium]
MRIKIDYLPDSREALLSTDLTGKVWTAILRACQDYADTNLIITGELTISLPWWSFLLAREAIGYHVSVNNIDVEFTEKAEQLLQEAAVKTDAYDQAASAEPISQDFLTKHLHDAGFERPLKPEQENNVKRIANLPAAATFSVPGAGKTTEALAYFCCRKSPNSKLFIVCPKNAFAVWEEQIKLIFPKEKISVKRLTGGPANIATILNTSPDVSLISYHQVPTVQHLIASYLLENDVFVFLDESHRMKRGDSGVIGNAILSMSHLPKAKCILSGTPLPNSIADLIPQFRFLYPEVPVNAENVKELIRPIYVRTTKRQLDIPKITRIETPISLLPAQRSLYQLLCSEIERENYSGLSSYDKRKLRHLGRSALRLLQLVSNPALLIQKLEFEHKELLSEILSEADSPKIEYVTRKARQLAAKKEKVIIWSTFIKNVELISSRLIDLGADFIHGGVETGDEEENTREAKIKRFHEDPHAFVLVANPAACSESISLHKVCHYAIYLDRNYNAAQYLQSEDRIHRLGLDPDQKTVIEIVYSPDTVDESVASRLKMKVNLMSDVLEDPDLNIDPIPYDPDDDLAFDFEDAKSFLDHVKTEAKNL